MIAKALSLQGVQHLSCRIVHRMDAGYAEYQAPQAFNGIEMWVRFPSSLRGNGLRRGKLISVWQQQRIGCVSSVQDVTFCRIPQRSLP
jgi:hypothetical protein